MGRWAGAGLWIMVCGVSGAVWAGQEFLIAGGGNDQSRPAISGTLVVWQEESDTSGTWDIKGADIRNPFSPDRFTVSADIYGDETNPAISGHWATCATSRQIEVDNLADPFISRLVSGTLIDTNTRPAICQNVVVWAQKQGGQWDIYGYNLVKKSLFQVTNQASDQVQPQISFSPTLGAYLVVWADRRNGNWDIYGKVLDSPDQVGGCATALKGDVNEDCKVDALDVSEVQSRLGQINGVPAN